MRDHSAREMLVTSLINVYSNVFWTRKVKICIELILVFDKSMWCVVFHTSLIDVCSLERGSYRGIFVMRD